MEQVQSGILLISDPFLKDPNFMRTVVLLCEHQESEGSFGLVLNKPMNLNLEDIVDQADGLTIPVFNGGPVQKDSLHFIHRQPELLGGSPITSDIFWGGDFQKVLDFLHAQVLQADDIRFFVGYSGWEKDQLAGELTEKSWITRPANTQLVFPKNSQQVWKQALADMGGEYSQMINYPIDPQLN